MHIAYFLEDLGHENFICPLVERVHADSQKARIQVTREVRNSTGGSGKALRELELYLKELRGPPYPDAVIVTRDTDCKGVESARAEVQSKINASGYTGRLIIATPDPYIEKWYLADVQALQALFRCPETPQVPARDCNPKMYKDILRNLLRTSGVNPPLGGIEYGNKIVGAIDLYRARKADQSLELFVNDLRGFFGDP